MAPVSQQSLFPSDSTWHVYLLTSSSSITTPACRAALHGCPVTKPCYWISHKDPQQGAAFITFWGATWRRRIEWMVAAMLLHSALGSFSSNWDVLMDKDWDSSSFPPLSKCLKPPAGSGNQAQLLQAQTLEQKAGWDAALAERKTSCLWYVKRTLGNS